MNQKRAGILLALCFAFVPLCAAGPSDKKPSDKNAYYTGRVVSLADLLAKDKIKIDADQVVLVLQTDDGKLYPLVKEIGRASCRERV